MQVVTLLTVGLLIRLIWVVYTQYTAEDAFITFQFARRLAEGHGFTYNVGDPIYGTTTPLFTLLMAGWLLVTGQGEITFAAHFVDIIASVGSLVILYLILRRTNVPHLAQLLALGVLVISSKIYLIEMQGMETPVVILLMMVSWYAVVADRPHWAGFFAGCLLWTRIDLVFWPVALIAVEMIFNFKNAVRMGVVTALTYLPWVVFASLYFGSPIPYTITAKWVVYGIPGPPLEIQLATILEYLSPFAFDRTFSFEAMLLAIGCITVGIAAWQAIRFGKNRAFLVLPLFGLLETARLALSGATFFSRYFHPLLWVVLILFAIGLASLWQTLSHRWSISAWIPRCLLAAGLVLMATQAVYRLNLSRFEQTYANDGSIKMIGLWLNKNSAPNATVYLEPLGYVGYYANRKMYDEIGLVTPRVVELRLKGIDPKEYFHILWPDYVVLHCDDGLRLTKEPANQENRFADSYRKVAGFNPLNFDPDLPQPPSDIADITRIACYDIWQRIMP